MRKTGFEKINGYNIFYILTELDSINLTTRKIVIMSHGFRGSSIGPARTFVDFENLLLKEKISVLRFDQPCSGNSEGDFQNSSFNQWINTLSYFVNKYINLNYKICLLGQSMGATATMVVAAKKKYLNKIPCIILWVPDPKINIKVEKDKFYEEAGQKYKGKFWIEAKQSNFFKALDEYKGKIHLVYGENDRYVSKELRDKVINKIKEKNQFFMILPKQDHSPWDYNIVNKVYKEEIEFLKKFL